MRNQEQQFKRFLREKQECERAAWQSFVQQQQEYYTPDWTGGLQTFEFQRANAGAATLTGTGLSIIGLAGKMLIFYSVGAIGGGSISCQMQSCSNSGGTNPQNVGAAFGVAAGSGIFQIDLENLGTASGQNSFMRSVVTIVTGSTPVVISGFGFNKLI